ncbi:lanthionine synthetase C family protein [Myxococcaceae bacterium GXIMD 01537]
MRVIEDLPRIPSTGPLASSLARGHSGRAVLFAYLSRADASHLATQDALLGAATEALATETLYPDLFDGFPGIAWAVQHLQGTPEAPDDDPLSEIDGALGDLLQTRPWPHRYDLVSGLVGLGVYALERLPRASARHCLESVVERLGELARPTREGLRWWTPAEHIEEGLQATYPQGCANLGAAHGVPGVLVVLAGAVASGVASERARELLRGGWTWLMARRGDDSAAARFPTRLGPDDEPRAWPPRPAWCYGDPGLALALHVSARAVGEPAWEEQALALCRESAQRWTDASLVRDAGLCHGAAGLAHLHNRLFQATGEPCFEEAARHWFRQVFALQRPGHGIGGFQTLELLPDGTEGWTDNPGLLAGATGIALALLAATSPVEPEWDRLLLMSLRPAADLRP